MASTSASTFVQFHSVSSSNPQLFLTKLPNNNQIFLSSSSSFKRASNYKRVYTKAVSTDSQKPLLTEDKQNTPSSLSSKLVLVLGASGGVGKHCSIFLLSVNSVHLFL
jgi:hypothetical protein